MQIFEWAFDMVFLAILAKLGWSLPQILCKYPSALFISHCEVPLSMRDMITIQHNDIGNDATFVMV